MKLKGQTGKIRGLSTEAQKYFDRLAKKTLQWMITRDKSLGAKINSQKGGIHAIIGANYIDTRLPPSGTCLRA